MTTMGFVIAFVLSRWAIRFREESWTSGERYFGIERQKDFSVD